MGIDLIFYFKKYYLFGEMKVYFFLYFILVGFIVEVVYGKDVYVLDDKLYNNFFFFFNRKKVSFILDFFFGKVK